MIKYLKNPEKEKLVESKFKTLLKFCRETFNKDDLKEVRKAFDFIVEHHKDCTKKSGELCLIHSLEVAIIGVKEFNLGKISVISSLFHNLILDKDVYLEEIKNEFGEQVAVIVQDLTKIGSINVVNATTQAENFRKLFLTLVSDARVILIKIADRLHNMRILDLLPRDAQIRVANETQVLYAPTAHRLGLYKVKTELEDLSLKYLLPNEYFDINQKIHDTTTQRNKFIREFTQPIRKEMLEIGFDFTIKGRPKSIYSIWNKMNNQGVSFEEVYDLFAIRIIINSKAKSEKADCWQVYSIASNYYQPNPERMRDWISVPKSNGYESLHTTVVVPGGRWVEVQIRTKRMDEIAEKGFAAHWKYKGIESTQGIEEWLEEVREVLETPSTSDPDKFVNDYKLNLVNEEIFVFTPKGDLKRLPSNSVILDFAFDIHSEVGSSCIGAKINGRNVSIREKLQNGSKVEILTSKNQKPKQDWLEFVKTSKAKSKIKQAIQEERFKEVENGKEILKRRLRNWKISFSEIIINSLIKHYKLNNALELYYQIANEKINLPEVKEFLSQKEVVTEKKETEEENIEEISRQYFYEQEASSEDHLIIDNAVDNLDYKLSKCCHPINGDEIFAFVTVSEGIKIHRSNCPNAVQLLSKYPYRVLKAKWKNSDDNITYQTTLKVTGANEFDMISRISDVISKDLKVNLRSINADSEGGVFSAVLKVDVHDKKHLNVLLHKLEKVKGVNQAKRFYNIEK